MIDIIYFLRPSIYNVDVIMEDTAQRRGMKGAVFG